MISLAFAIPGDLRTRTGGYVYERRLLEGLRAIGHPVRHIELPASFPDPSPDEMARALAVLAEVGAGTPLILDGFLSGTLAAEGLARLAAPLAAVVHHPLGLETGLTPDRARHLIASETANLRHMGCVVVPSPHTARTLVADFGVPKERIAVAPPGFDRVTRQGRPVAPPLVLSVGILHPRKGHDTLIDALAMLTELDWQAVIVGKTVDANHAADLSRQIAAAGLDSRIRIAGEVDEATLAELYRTATVFALATRYEGYGMVLGEALRHGLPVVSCRTGAVPDTVPTGAGLLVPPSDPPAFAAALRRTLCEPALRERLSAGAARAGAALPDWSETAAIVSRRVTALVD